MTAPSFFDVPTMLRDLQTLVELESPSSDLAAVARVQDVVEGWLSALGAEGHALPGGSRRFVMGEASRPTLILMHADTVWPHGTLQTMPFRVEGERAYGPGSYDMKGGIVSALWALRSLEGRWPAGGVEVLLTPDEEVSSGASRGHIVEAAGRAARVLVVEPPVAGTNALKTGRKGVGGLTVTLTGVASHAGNAPEQGASAITEAARLLLELQALARPELGTTVSAGTIQGGSATNVIPAHARFTVDLRVSQLAEGERLEAAARALRTRDPRVRMELTGGLERPPFERLPGTAELFTRAQAIASRLGFEVGEAVVGGGSDGNFTAPISPTLDGLGAPGDGAHADHEHVRLDRWPLHAALLAGLIRGA